MNSSTRTFSTRWPKVIAGAHRKAPVEVGLLALALLLQAYCHVSDRDAVELTVMDKRWQMVLDCLGTDQPPFSQGTLCNFRLRLMAHNLDKTLLDRTVTLGSNRNGIQLGSNSLLCQLVTQYMTWFRHEGILLRSPLFHTGLHSIRPPGIDEQLLQRYPTVGRP